MDWVSDHLVDRTTFGYILAVLVAIVGGGLAQSLLGRGNLVHPDDRAQHRSAFLLPTLVGHVERALYLGALLAGQPIFVGLWFTLKSLGASNLLGNRRDTGERDDKERRLYQRFLLLGGVSLAWAGGGWAVGQAVHDHQDMRATWASVGLVGGTLCLVWMAHKVDWGDSTAPSAE